MESDVGWKVAAAVSGIVGVVSAFLPILSFDAGALGFDVVSSEMTLLDIADLGSSLGQSPDGIYFVLLLIIGGSILLIASLATNYFIAIIGSLIQTAGVGWLVYTLLTEGVFTSVDAFGIEAGVSPSIGLFGLVIASLIGLATLAL